MIDIFHLFINPYPHLRVIQGLLALSFLPLLFTGQSEMAVSVKAGDTTWKAQLMHDASLAAELELTCPSPSGSCSDLLP